MKVDTDKLDLIKLEKLQKQIGEIIVDRKKKARSEVLKQVRALVAKNGMTMDDLLGTRRARGKANPAKPKYANPDNAKETWTGRGRMPLWMREKTDKGASRDDFLIR